MLAALGATVERPRFRVPLASEVRRAEVSVTIGGKPAYITPGLDILAFNDLVDFGYDGSHWINAYDLDAAVSTYVPVQLQFEKAGNVEFTVLTVPPTGIYEGIAPMPATAPLG